MQSTPKNNLLTFPLTIIMEDPQQQQQEEVIKIHNLSYF